MTGRRLYDALTDAWAAGPGWERKDNGEWLHERPPAWAFLKESERRTFNGAARALTASRRRK